MKFITVEVQFDLGRKVFPVITKLAPKADYLEVVYSHEKGRNVGQLGIWKAAGVELGEAPELYGVEKALEHARVGFVSYGCHGDGGWKAQHQPCGCEEITHFQHLPQGCVNPKYYDIVKCPGCGADSKITQTGKTYSLCLQHIAFGGEKGKLAGLPVGHYSWYETVAERLIHELLETREGARAILTLPGRELHAVYCAVQAGCTGNIEDWVNLEDSITVVALLDMMQSGSLTHLGASVEDLGQRKVLSRQWLEKWLGQFPHHPAAEAIRALLEK